VGQYTFRVVFNSGKGKQGVQKIVTPHNDWFGLDWTFYLDWTF
jgi:hypothetical protein